MHLECRCREDKHLVLLILDPPQELVDSGDDLQLAGGGTEGGVELEGLSDPAENYLLIRGVVTELDLLCCWVDQPALYGEVDSVQPAPVLLQQVAGAVEGGDVLGRGPGLIKEVSHLTEVYTLSREVDGLEGGGNVCDSSVSLYTILRSVKDNIV